MRTLCLLACQHIQKQTVDVCQSDAGIMQATVSGFGLVNSENVFRVCDQPHPLMVHKMVGLCLEAKLDEAWGCMRVRLCSSCLLPAGSLVRFSL